MARRSLRVPVILFGVISCIWALVWANDAFQSIGDDKSTVPAFVKFDIVLGVLYSVAALIEIYGIIAAFTARIVLVRIYSMLSFFAVALVVAIEILRLVLHFTFKQAIINNCFNSIRGDSETVENGNIFNPHYSTQPITDAEATSDCNSAWSNETFQDVAWLLVAAVLGFIFATINYAFYRQLVDPNLMRTQAPSSAYQMNATRNAFGYRNNTNIPGYNPYQSQTYGDYVPPYDNKPPGYMSGGYEHFDGDEKVGYTGAGALNPFDDHAAPTTGGQGYTPSGPPPGLESHNHDRSASDLKDEGFDPVALETAIKTSEKETKGPGRDLEFGAGPSSSAR